MKKTITVNLFGGAGSGKSTAAAYIYSVLKMRGIKCELISEFAKDLTWEKNVKALKCQEYIFGNQSFKMEKCREEVDVLITDSPLLLSWIYNSNPILNDDFKRVVISVFNKYDNINYVLNRPMNYEETGRNQVYSEAIEFDTKILNFLVTEKIPFFLINNTIEDYNSIITTIEKKLFK